MARHFVLSLTFLLLFAASSIVVVEPAPFDILMSGMIALAVLTARRHPDFTASPHFRAALLLAVLFLAANVLALLLAPDQSEALRFAVITAYLLFGFVGLCFYFRVHGAQLADAAFKGYVLSALISSILGILAFFKIDFVGRELLMGGRIVAFFKDPNVFAPFLVPASLYALDRFRVSRGMPRMLAWTLTFCLLSATVLLCFSRGAWGNYAVALFAYLVLRPPPAGSLLRPRIVFGLAAFLVSLCAAFYFLFTSNVVQTVLVERLATQAYDEDRFATQQVAFQTALSYPAGIGPGQSESRFDYATHSLYARVLVETGWLGAFALCALLTLTLVRTLRFARQGRSQSRSLHAIATAGIAGILLNSAVVDTLHWRHFWFLLAVAWGCYEAPALPSKVSGGSRPARDASAAPLRALCGTRGLKCLRGRDSISGVP
jgi:O-antigen ligase